MLPFPLIVDMINHPQLQNQSLQLESLLILYYILRQIKKKEYVDQLVEVSKQSLFIHKFQASLQSIYQMGQSNSQTLFSKNSITTWRQLQRQPSIFQNVVTHEQVQRFIIRIKARDVGKEITYFNKRIGINNSPFICQVFCIQNIEQTKDLKPYQDWAVYTNRIFIIRQSQWTLSRFVMILEGIIYLVKMYSPFRINEKMIWTNEKGEIKIWMSQNPAFSRPDYIAANQEQTLASFTSIVVKKNIQAANMLIGCKNLNQAHDQLSRPQRQERSFHIYANRTLNERNNANRAQKYRNVFRQNAIQLNQIPNQNKKAAEDFKIHLTHDYQTEKNLKPQSNFSMNLSNKIFQRSGPIEFIKSGNQFLNNISFNQAQKKQRYCQDSLSAKYINPNNNLGENISKKTNQPKQYLFYYPNLAFAAGPKQVISNPHNNDENITIIHNNIGSVVNNITLNHRHCNIQPQKTQFRYKTPEFTQNMFAGKQRHQSSKSREKGKAPLFIQQRKFRNKSASPLQTNKNVKSSDVYSKMSSHLNTAYSADTPNKSTQESFNHIHHPNLNRKNHKLFVFNKGNQSFNHLKNSKSHNATSSFSPHQTPNKKCYRAAFVFHEPSRTKTTDFSQSFKHHLKPFLPNHSFRQNEKSFQASFENTFNHKYVINQQRQDKIIQQEVGESMPTTKSIDLAKQIRRQSLEKEEPVDNKGNLKKALKLEIGFLLEPKFEPQVNKEQKQQQAVKNKQFQIQESGNLQQKIKMKQIAFADLKKQALAVLTDLF